MTPLVVIDPSGALVVALMQNPKGQKKTLERGELWALHPETGRLLPVFPGVAAVLIDHETWFEARLASVPDSPAFEAEASGESEEQIDERVESEITPAARTDEPVSGAVDSATDSAVSAGANEPADTHAGSGSRSVASIGAVLSDLSKLIHERHVAMPEGSYTTHLFSSGSEKIRKKFGEEAVELLLASEREHLVSETSDLIYHLLVLLEAEGVSLDEIAAELHKR